MSFYQPLPGDKFLCLDKSAMIPFTSVNDDFCDCLDGSDEPGTSACDNGRFYCQNTGHIPSVIPSSKVNDGVCDPECCSGEDEWNSSVKCPDTCKQAGDVYRKQMEAQESIHKEGARQRREYIKFGKKSKASRLVEIKKLEAELKKDAVTLEHLRVAKETAEKADELKQEAEKPVDHTCPTRLEECEKSYSEVTDKIKLLIEEGNQGFANMGDDSKSKCAPLMDKIRDIQDTLEGEVIEESEGGSESAAAESVESEVIPPSEHIEEPVGTATPVEQGAPTVAAFIPPVVVPTINPRVGGLPEAVITPPNAEQPKPKIHPCDDYDASFTACLVTTISDNVIGMGIAMKSPLTWRGWRSLKRSYAKLSGRASSEPLDFAQLSADVEKARSKYLDFERAKNEKQQKLDELKKKRDIDFGPAGEWEKLYKTCFVGDAAEYKYEICILDKVVQKQGGMNTDLGHFTRWGGRDESSTPGALKYTRMMFENGVMCWNGPARSMEVFIECGKENVVLTASEPSKCEYTMKIQSPAACVEEGDLVSSKDEKEEL
ncbi:hypothetical protein SmJEL517_g04457 [Synchytrium microbalum]|uniref:Glucosidase 2 subunit beta n=1 Tax=Synchytrium microbalum TaxID=1806994 RepID=A0A507C4J0_9FUNG|nr:uncharacterized protein SmJEL517_g04457 [Synchytrium microbalum]TPX32453.1 hypothetical protein SmJEL517_g04457 [Synchytrium microbalum]